MMLAVSWLVCRGCVDRLDVRRTVTARSWIGLVPFLVLMSAEIVLGAVYGRSLWDQVPPTSRLPECLVWPLRWSSPRSRSFRFGGSSPTF